MHELTGSYVFNTVLIAQATPDAMHGDADAGTRAAMFTVSMAAFMFVLHGLGHKYMKRCILGELIDSLAATGNFDVTIINIDDDDEGDPRFN